jgi:hypothetical protein
MSVKLRPLHVPKGAEALLKELLAVQVKFMVVGGMGVQHYCPQRAASELEVLIPADETNAMGVVEALVRIGFKIAPETVRILFTPGQAPQQISLQPTLPITLLMEGEGFDFEAHLQQSELAGVLSRPVHVASPQLIISMKSRNLQEEDALDIARLQNHIAGLASG